MFATAFVKNLAGLLIVGGLIGFLAALVFGTGLDLAIAVNTVASAWVHAGMAVGSAAPIGLISHLDFTPDSNLGVRMAFFALPGIACIIGGFVYWWYHIQLEGFARFLAMPPGQQSQTSQSDESQEIVGTVQGLSNAYRQMQEPAGEGDTEGSRSIGFLALMACVYSHIFFGMASSFFLLALIPSFGAPIEAQVLYLYKVAGDVIGRLVGTAIAGPVAWILSLPRADNASEVPPALSKIRWFSYGIVIVKAAMFRVAIAMVLALPAAFPSHFQMVRAGAGSEYVVWGMFGVFCFGSMANSILDIVAPRQSRHLHALR